MLTLWTDQGAFVAKWDPAADPIRLRLRLGLMAQLSADGRDFVPDVVLTTDGEGLLVSDQGCLWIMEYIPRRLPSTQPEQDWAALGVTAATLNACSDQRVRFEVPVRAALVEMADWVRGRSFERRYLSLLNRIEHLADLEPSGVIHGEINAANAARRESGTVVLLDWDQVGYGPVALEIGYPLITSFIGVDDLELDARSAAAFYSGYVSAGGQVEPTVAFDAALFHALRYMRFSQVDARWRRVCHALDNRELICAVITGERAV